MWKIKSVSMVSHLLEGRRINRSMQVVKIKSRLQETLSQKNKIKWNKQTNKQKITMLQGKWNEKSFLLTCTLSSTFLSSCKLAFFIFILWHKMMNPHSQTEPETSNRNVSTSRETLWTYVTLLIDFIFHMEMD